MDYFFKNVLVFDKSVKMYIKNYFEKLGSFQCAPPSLAIRQIMCVVFSICLYLEIMLSVRVTYGTYLL